MGRKTTNNTLKMQGKFVGRMSKRQDTSFFSLVYTCYSCRLLYSFDFGKVRQVDITIVVWALLLEQAFGMCE